MFGRSFAVLAVILVIVSAQQNLRPVIGIVTEPTSPSLAKYGNSFISAGYVKFVEMAGARVVPIPHNATAQELQDLVSQLNGALIPGGAVTLKGSSFYATVKFLVQYSISAAAHGETFPIHATCLGFEAVGIVVDDDNFALLESFDADDITMNLDFAPDAMQSKMFSNAPAKVVDILANQDVTMNNHVWGIGVPSFQSKSRLTDFFTLISTNVDRKGKPFVSTMEGKKAPIFATQFHPEKPMFEWPVKSAIDHSSDSIYANQYFANFFVDQARHSTQRFESVEKEEQALIYHHAPVYTYHDNPTYQQCYFF